MAESTAFPKPREANDAGYQRISTFAVAGLVVGILFALFLLLQVIMGLLSHSTVLMPLWLEFFAALGAGLSLVGARGLWISLVAGLGYGSYYGATYLAIRQQADTFVREWFDQICKGKVNRAFLLTQPPGVARDANPDDDRTMEMRFNAATPGPRGGPAKGGPLDLFRYNEIIQTLKQGGEATKVTSLGVRSWERRDAAYMVKRVYGIETPEGTFDLQITALGREGADAGAKWLIAFNDTLMEKDSLKKTKLGERIDLMRGRAQKFLDEWAKSVLMGHWEEAYIKTLDPKEALALANREQTRVAAILLCSLADTGRGGIGSLVATFLPTDREILHKVALPGYEAAFTKAGILDFTQFKSDDKAANAAVEGALRDMLAPSKESTAVAAALIARPSSGKRLWSVDNERRVLLPVDCQIIVGPKGSEPKYFADAVAWVQSDPGQLDDETTPRWRLVKIEILRAADVAELQTMGRPIAASRFN
jgi:hypothetical protein